MLGSGTLSAVAGSYGVANYMVTSAQSMALPVGTVSLTGTYAGDTNYGSGSTPAPAATLTVTGPSALAPTTTTATAMPQTDVAQLADYAFDCGGGKAPYTFAHGHGRSAVGRG